MLIDGDTAEEAEALLVAGRHDDRIAFARAAEEIAREDRRSGGRSADDATASQHVMECLLGLGASVRINQMPLPASLEPDTAGTRHYRGEAVAVGELLVDRVEDDDVL